MLKIVRPLLLFGRNRPNRLTDGQLANIRRVAFVNVVFILAGVTWLVLGGMSQIVLFVVRAVLLLLAVIPGILMEYYLASHVTDNTDDDAFSPSKTVFITEFLQYVFVLLLGLFLTDIL
ncbi:hypothetical protein [Pseudohongiella acticola]|mgnify:CR=1 FL=1|jgi:hypothetical protein|uniref:hypothetical protein n=1 Tax=Pseudohongiella acticola TaxID=1524254 RepID=UPI0030EB339D